jgi:hypothetical protein
MKDEKACDQLHLLNRHGFNHSIQKTPHPVVVATTLSPWAGALNFLLGADLWPG